MSKQRITIDPITRLEGHGKIEIFLNDDGEVSNAYFQVPELRGFEKFCEGRPVESQKYAVYVRVVIIWHQVKLLMQFLVLIPLRLQKNSGNSFIWHILFTVILPISMPWQHLILLSDLMLLQQKEIYSE
ncbi:MAG: nickel-dependent hydrogenase large subunit [Bacteroidetes bacterium]|nr:nickel-dependent hydrogenase large subunit [Bacteroidota bacterium]